MVRSVLFRSFPTAELNESSRPQVGACASTSSSWASCRHSTCTSSFTPLPYAVSPLPSGSFLPTPYGTVPHPRLSAHRPFRPSDLLRPPNSCSTFSPSSTSLNPLRRRLWDVADDAFFAKQHQCCPALMAIEMPLLSPGLWTLIWFIVSFILFIGFILAALATWKQSPHAMYCQAQTFLPCVLLFVSRRRRR